jgi:hypothetical protein
MSTYDAELRPKRAGLADVVVASTVPQPMVDMRVT